MEDATMESDRKKGHFTFRTTAVLFVISALFELIVLTSETPLLGEMRGGMTAIIYHVIYLVLYAALGVGLWSAKKWGYTIVFVTTIIETLDGLQFLLDQKTFQAYVESVEKQISLYEGELQSAGIDKALLMQSILQSIELVCVVGLLCWWGFALYTYWRRDYFKSESR
jgi:hypothetical protein